jgi:DNA repair protein RadD
VCLQHEGYPRQKAIAWWRRRAPEVAVPDTIEEALRVCAALKRPTQICVRPSGKFTEIIGARLP